MLQEVFRSDESEEDHTRGLHVEGARRHEREDDRRHGEENPRDVFSGRVPVQTFEEDVQEKKKESVVHEKNDDRRPVEARVGQGPGQDRRDHGLGSGVVLWKREWIPEVNFGPRQELAQRAERVGVQESREIPVIEVVRVIESTEKNERDRLEEEEGPHPVGRANGGSTCAGADGRVGRWRLG